MPCRGITAFLAVCGAQLGGCGTRAGDEEQSLRLGRCQAGQVCAAVSGQTPSAVPPLQRIDREAGDSKRIQVTPGSPFRNLQFDCNLGGRHLPAGLQHQQDRYEAVGAHIAILSHKQVSRWPVWWRMIYS